MTIEKAIGQLLTSEKFKEHARKDARLRIYLGRHQKGMLKTDAAIKLLLEFGYKIEVKKR